MIAALVPADTSAALDYHHASNVFWALNQLMSLLLPLTLLLTGLGTRGFALCARWTGGNRHAAVAIFAGTYFILDRLVRTPVEFLWSRAYSRAQGLEVSSFLPWIGGEVGSWLLPLAGVSLAAVLVYAAIARSPQRWWAGVFGAGAVVVFVGLYAEPFVKDYRPLGNSALETSIIQLAGRAHIPPRAIVLEHCETVDDCPPGHVIGLGPARLMVLNEAALARDPAPWTLQMVAHESKHFALDDNVKAFLLLSGLLLAALIFVHHFVGACARRYSTRLGFSQLGDPASLPLAVLVLLTAYLAILPPLNAFRQSVELEADRFALEFNRDSRAQSEMVASWSKESKFRVVEPSRFYKLFRATHPSDAERLRLADEYHPWRQGADLYYGTVFDAPAPRL